MAMLGERVRVQPDDIYLQILSQADNGGWVLSLPPSLKAQQTELEQLLGQVFTGRPTSAYNLALAQQMSLNWCMSKCKKAGVSLDDCMSGKL